MPLNVQCKACANLINNWCKPVCDSPDPDLPRDCSHYRTLRNSDRLRAMTDEELAEWLAAEEWYETGANNCPLVPVHNHGRLIDADALLRQAWGVGPDGLMRFADGIATTMISTAPTIIPADPADKEGEG